MATSTPPSSRPPAPQPDPPAKKTLVLNDWYLKGEDWDYPWGSIQMLGKSDGEQLQAMAPGGLQQMRRKFDSMLAKLGFHEESHQGGVYLHEGMNIAATAHQAGTARFGSDPETSVLDVNCQPHELDNLYVVDSRFFASIGAVNPTLTISPTRLGSAGTSPNAWPDPDLASALGSTCRVTRGPRPP